jgi:hypothetical protein
MNLHFKINRRETGQSLVELALVFVFMLVLALGTVNFGLAFFQWLTLRDAAQEGAIFASIMPDEIAKTENGEVYRRIRTSDLICTASNCPWVIPNTNASILKDAIVSITYSGTGYCRGVDGGGNANSVTVALSYDYQFIFPIPTSLLGNNANDYDHINLRAKVTNTMLNPPCAP